MAEILELPKWEFKVTLINMLRVLMEKVGNIQEWMDNLCGEMKTLSESKGSAKNQKTLTEMKTILSGLISRL